MEANIQRLVAQYRASKISAHVQDRVRVGAHPGGAAGASGGGGTRWRHGWRRAGCTAAAAWGGGPSAVLACPQPWQPWLHAAWKATALAAHRRRRCAAPLQALDAAPGEKYVAGAEQPSWPYQTAVLTARTFLNK